MDNVLLLIMMITIGAIIGGMTNSLAIRMLFRPYQPVIIGKWKLPFTPGLIPKRRNELANQLGKMVVDHLLTPEGMKKKLQEPVFHEQVISWAKSEAETILDKELSVGELLQEAGFSVDEQEIRRRVSSWSVSKYQQFIQQNEGKQISQFMDEGWRDKLGEAGVQLADRVQVQLVLYAESEETREKIGNMIDEYLEDKGFLANMLSSFLGNERLSDKIQPHLVQYAKSYEVNLWLREMIDREVTFLLDQPVAELAGKIGKDRTTEVIREIAEKALPVEKWLNRSLSDWIGSYRPELIEKIVPKLTDIAGQTLVERVDTLMEQLHLADIVEREVATFPISRLEQLVLDISRKEFKMITYLGALLGGLIGLVQGIIVLMLN